MRRPCGLLRFVLVCAVTFAVLLPGQPAAAEPARSGIQVGPVFVRHDGHRYRVMLDADEMYGRGYVQ
jgi:hypothetical protein